MGFLINEKKCFYFVLNQCHYRTGAIIGKTVGVIEASNEEEAHAKINAQYGSTHNVLTLIEEFDPAEGFTYTIYKCNF